MCIYIYSSRNASLPWPSSAFIRGHIVRVGACMPRCRLPGTEVIFPKCARFYQAPVPKPGP